MSVFADYSKYYDLLYQDKDYNGEVAYIEKIFSEYTTQSKDVLELGCGTGKHAELLSERGFNVHGIDRSEEMLIVARERKKKAKYPERLAFEMGDLKNIAINRSFDTAISLFHVFSYLNTNDELLGALTTAKKHLKKKGHLIFDCWYGPAVLTERPIVRVKRLENESVKIIRIAEPEIDTETSLVYVNYTVIVENKNTCQISILKERHTMRYLFKTEIDLLLRQAGFELIGAKGWLTSSPPSEETWGAVFVAQLL